MPKPQGDGQRYMPGLDGLRAVAVLAVIAYHEQFGWAKGGLLGVAVFFTLSGYLITDLLLAQWAADGKLRLKDFWIRRARRLLPAVFVLLAVVSAWVTMADRARLASLRGPVAAAVSYTSNWYLIIKNQSYFARFAPPQPFDHLWSLAVEEQFYLLWPWLLLLALLCLRRFSAKSAEWLAIPTLALAAGFGGRDAAAVPPRTRSDPSLRRHRHPGVRPADRRGNGDDLAQPRLATPQARHHLGGRRGRGGRPGHRRGHDRDRRPVLIVHLPRRPGTALASPPP